MAFSTAQYESVVDELVSGCAELTRQVGRISPTASAAVDHWYVPDPVAAAVRALAAKLVSITTTVLHRIQELLEGAAAPVLLYLRAQDWSHLRGEATLVGSALTPQALDVDTHWQGRAADAYVRAIGPQSAAALRVGALADRTQAQLTLCAATGLAFYVALGLILAKLIAATVAAVAALGSVVFSWAGVALIVEEAAVTTAMVVTAVAAATAAAGSQAAALATLRGEAADSSAFPGGRWPRATSERYRDATVKDGDADWSIDT